MIKKNNLAFTFIELSILIAIISVIFTFSVVIKERLDDVVKNADTENKIHKIRVAIASYYKTNGKIPCPARLDYDIYHSEYGAAVADDGYNCNVSSGVFGFGGDGNNDSKQDLYIGAVPIKELGLDIEDSIDSWGRKISYVASSLVRNINNRAEDFPLSNHLSCWLDFSDGSSLTLRQHNDFYYISKISDKSPSGNCDAIQNDDSYQPMIKTDNIASTTLIGAYFDGVDDYLQINNNSLHDLFEVSHTLFFVANFDHNATTHRGLLSYGNSGDPSVKELYYSDKNSGNLSFKNLRGNSTSYIIGGVSENEPNIFSVTRTGSYIYNPYFDYVDLGSKALNTALPSNINFVTIGKDLYDSTGDFIFVEEIYEFIAYKTALSDNQIKEILEYLYGKWRTNNVQQNRVVIKDSSNFSRSNASIVLISHGSNGFGAYNMAGKQIDYSAIAETSLEYNNIPRSNGMNNNIYTDLLSGNHDLGEGWIKGFDDIVRYYNIFELRTVSGR